jgi:RNA polymerase sigma-70 factor, ECF subfamily
LPERPFGCLAQKVPVPVSPPKVKNHGVVECVSKMSSVIAQTVARSANRPRDAWSDEELLIAYRDGNDRPSFEELVRRYEKELYGYLRHYLGDAEMAEDVFQQTFLQIHLKCDQFTTGRKVRPWLYAVATNQAIDYRRRTGRHRMASLDRRMGGDGENETAAWIELFDVAGRGPAEQSERSEQHAKLRRAVEELPEQARQVIMLVFFQGLKYREAAEMLSIPLGTVKSRMNAAIHKLSGALAPPCLPP